VQSGMVGPLVYVSVGKKILRVKVSIMDRGSRREVDRARASIDSEESRKQRSPAMAKSPDDMVATMIANLKEKTGKTLPQWMKIARGAKLDKHGQIVKFLKEQHGMTHGFANLVAHKTLAGDAESSAGTEDLVAAQYSGPKSDLRPIYDALLAAMSTFGKDVEIAPKKTYVSLRRNKQFGLIQPSTKTRVDVGINLKGAKATGRLEPSGNFNAMVSHRVRLTSAKDVDKELIGWLKKAYDAS
jgi:hypothetical protein